MSSSGRRGKRKRERVKTQGEGEWSEGGPRHVICEDKLMQNTMLGQFGIKIRRVIIEKIPKRKREKHFEYCPLSLFHQRFSRSALSQRKCFINEASLDVKFQNENISLIYYCNRTK